MEHGKFKGERPKLLVTYDEKVHLRIDKYLRNVKDLRSKEVIIVLHLVNICGFDCEELDNSSHGANMKRISNWQIIIDKMTNRLSMWKSIALSFGERLTLLKSVMGILPLYYFSLFKEPKSIIRSFEKLIHNFFWSGSGPYTTCLGKIANFSSSRDFGGLGIGSLKYMNLALLGKWWWRFMKEKSSLWVEIITRIYGNEGGLNGVVGNHKVVSRMPSVRWEKPLIHTESTLVFFPQKIGPWSIGVILGGALSGIIKIMQYIPTPL